MYDEGAILQEAITNLPCELELPSYNDAISLRARLNRYLKGMKELYAGRENPFENLDILLAKPRTLRFEQRGQFKLRPVTEKL